MIGPVFILNGPNLDLLGDRQPEIYGRDTLGDVERECRETAGLFGLSIRFHQSNAEAEIIDRIHDARETALALIVNPGGLTFTSIAVLDVLNACDFPVFEVHISNLQRREPFRHHSFVSVRADGVIAGFGTQGYSLAVRHVAGLLDRKKDGA